MSAKVVCAWCGLVLKDGTEPISHGICETCSQHLLSIDPPKDVRETNERIVTKATENWLRSA